MDRFLRPVLGGTVERVSFESDVEIWKVLQEYPQLVHILNHGPMFGPWPAAAYLAKKAVDNGGGDRTPFGMFHRLFFENRLLRTVTSRLFNSERPYTFDEILEGFEAGYYTDFMVLPEGDFCNFGSLKRLRPFRSHRYIELAVRLKAPLLLTAHRGTEAWAFETRLDNFSLAVAKRLLPDSFRWIANDCIVNVPAFPGRIPVFRMQTTLYVPTLKVEELSDNPDERRQQLTEESERVRARMNDMLAALDNQSAAQPTDKRAGMSEPIRETTA
jgi:hypothetical protein